MLAVIIEYIATVFIFVVASGHAFITISGLIFGLAMIEDIRGTLNSIHDDATSTKNNRQAVQQLCVYVQLHSNLKQLGQSDRILYIDLILDIEYERNGTEHIRTKSKNETRIKSAKNES